MAEKVVLDRESFKALASETRISILKALYKNRLTITQLSKELKVSKPALLKHMEALIEAKLVKKEEKERKWVYYDLTFKGKNVLHPERVAVTVLLTTAMIALGGAIFGFLDFLLGAVSRSSTSSSGSEYFQLSESPMSAATADGSILLLVVVLIVIFGVAIALAAIIKKKYGRPRF